jgi:hypothetical protein
VTYHCRADEIFTLTHHATNLIITQTGASIITGAGDTFDVQMITGTTCRIVNFQKAGGSGFYSMYSIRTMTNATGYASYGAVGFRPSFVIAFCCIDGSTTACIGMSDGAVEGGWRPDSTFSGAAISDSLIDLRTSATDYQKGVIHSFDSDGFTIDWTKVGTPTGTATLRFACFR